MRRGSLAGLILVLAAAAAFFRPVASAVNASRPTQTITVLALVLALGAVGIAWLVLRPRRYVQPIHLALASLAGAALALPLIPFIHDFDSAPRAQLTARLSFVALFNAAGILLFVMGM